MRNLIIMLTLLLTQLYSYAQENILNLNKPEREAWFTDLGFGMFIHWSYDVTLGMVISHSMVGASENYLNRYVHELPQYFNPLSFDPDSWAVLARRAGMKYVVFTAKHHNGFCMYDTESTSYNVTNTPFGRDATHEIIEAFRKQGLAIGLYYSPDDFYFLYKQGTLISRSRPEALASSNPELNAYVKEQMKELMTRYGKIDIVFLDGFEQFAKTELAKVCWEIDPDVVVTRGAIETPEQYLPDQPLPSPWEACYTMGNQWQYRPTNENYKSANRILTMLIQTRAQGGNLLLNVGPTQEGEIPREQAAILNEVALWMFINQEAMRNIEPWYVTREGDIWFTKKKDENTVFIYLTGIDWIYGERKEFLLRSVKSTTGTKISVLGHNGRVLEYRPDVDPKPYISESDEGLLISVVRAQRIYNDRKWPNPVVVKLENVTFSKE
jgi:alpha-L-fucosidase